MGTIRAQTSMVYERNRENDRTRFLETIANKINKKYEFIACIINKGNSSPLFITPQPKQKDHQKAAPLKTQSSPQLRAPPLSHTNTSQQLYPLPPNQPI